MKKEGAIANRYLFAGEQFDSSLGDYYLRDRYFNGTTGRFLRRDEYEGELEVPITLHKYIYANDDPVNGIDPSGFRRIPIPSNGDLGYAVGNLIGQDFVSRGGDRDYDRYPSPRLTFAKIKRELRSRGRSTNNARFFNNNGSRQLFTNNERPDMIDYGRSVIYEVKPATEIADGRDQINRYIGILSTIEGSGIWSVGTAQIYTPPREITVAPSITAVIEPPDDYGVIAYRLFRETGYNPYAIAAYAIGTAILLYLSVLALTKGFG